MRPEAEPVAAAIAARRSMRRFAARPVATTTVRELIALACTAPAPHQSRPWRFVHIATAEARETLADAMSDAWRADLEQEGRSVHQIADLLERSQRQITDAPVLLLACLCLDEARAWPDARRQAAEHHMFVQSLGAALQNLLLAAGERGLVGYLKGAPLFCQDAVRAALDLPPDWAPAFLVLLGYPRAGPGTAARPPVAAEEFLVER